MTPEDLANAISDTPFSLQVDDTSQPRLLRMALQIEEIRSRFELLRPSLKSIIRNSNEVRAYQAFHSNKLELQGPDLFTTTKIITEIPGEIVDLDLYLASKTVLGDQHLVDVVGLHQAHLLVERIALEFTSAVPFTESDLRNLNVFCVPDKSFRGAYRTTDRVNIGEFFDANDPLWFSRALPRPVEVKWHDIPIHMEKLCQFVSDESDCPPLSAAVAHAWFTHVHPFLDGNGRVARLLANLVLIRNGWPPLVVRHTDREDYLDSLEEGDIAGDIQLLFELFLNQIEIGLRELENPNFFDRLFRLELQKNEGPRMSTWITLATQFVDELRFHLRKYGFTIERLTMPSLSTFVLLEEGEVKAATLFAKIRHPDRREVRVGLGYMSPFMKRLDKDFDPNFDGQHYPPTIYFQERNFFPEADFPYVHRLESKIPVREVTFTANKNTDPCMVLLSNTGNKNMGSLHSMKFEQAAERVATGIAELRFLGFQNE